MKCRRFLLVGFLFAVMLAGASQVAASSVEYIDYTEDFVDNSNDDNAPTHKGTHSVFADLQDYGANYDQMQEEDQGAGSGGSLTSEKDTVASDATTSATWEDIDGLTLSITTGATSDILLVASIEVIGSTDAVGSWRLVFDGTNYLALDRQIDSTNAGNLMLTDLVVAKASGSYTFKVQHQVSTGTLTTRNAVITAIELHNGDGAVPASSDYVASDTVGNSWGDITGLTTDITLSATSHIWVILVANAYFSANNKDSHWAINIDATRMEEQQRDFTTSNQYGCVSLVTRTTTAKGSGTYTVKGEWKGAGGATLTGEDFQLVVIAAEANSGADSIDIQKDVVTSDSTTATAIEDITDLSVTANFDDDAHVISFLTIDSDVSVADTSAYTTMNIDSTDYDVMDRGHSSATQHGSIGQVVRTDSVITSATAVINGRWYTDSGNTLAGADIVLTSIVLYAGTPAALDYELDLEIGWETADFDESNEWLCIYPVTGGGWPSEDLKVDVWTGSWTNVFSDLTPDQWNNISISSYLTDATFEMRFLGGTETGDSTQDTFEIDAVLITTYSLAYTEDVYETIPLSDSTTVSRGATVTVNEVIPMYDSTSVSAGFGVVVSELIGFSDSVVVAMDAVLTIFEQINFAETVSVGANFVLIILESLGLAAIALPSAFISITTYEVIGLFESVVTTVAGENQFYVTIYEVIGASDSVETVLSASVTVLETIRFADSITATRGLSITVLEIIGLSDSTATSQLTHYYVYEVIGIISSVGVVGGAIPTVDTSSVFYQLFFSLEMWGYLGPIALVIGGYVVVNKEKILGVLWFVVECLFISHYLTLVAETPDYWWHIFILLLGGMLTISYAAWDRS